MSTTSASFFSIFLTSLLSHLPLILVWLIGLALALTRMQKHPKISLFASIAFLLMIVTSAASALSNAIIPNLVSGYNMQGSDVGMILTGVNIVLTLISTVAWALVLFAIFGGRKYPEESSQAVPTPVNGG